MRSFIVTAFFPQLKTGHAAFQSCVLKAPEIITALSRAFLELRKRPGVKGKHISEVRLTVKEFDPSAPALSGIQENS